MCSFRICLCNLLLLKKGSEHIWHVKSVDDSIIRPRSFAYFIKGSFGWALVNMLAICSSEGTLCTVIMPCTTCSIMKRSQSAIWRVRFEVEVLLAKELAFLLSPYIETGSSKSSCSPSNRFLMKHNSLVASVAARYSASIIDRVIALCFLDFHTIDKSPYLIT